MPLTLTRTPGQAILLPGGVRIVYAGPAGGRSVRLTIEAPRSVPIVREEIATESDRAELGHNATEGADHARR